MHGAIVIIAKRGGRLCLYRTAAAKGPVVQPPDDTWVNMEQWWNDSNKGKPKKSEKNLSQCHFVDHKSHCTTMFT
jgi:hypothetical protein